MVKTRDCNTGNPTSDMFYTTACQTRFLTGVYIIGGAGLGVLVIEVGHGNTVHKRIKICFRKGSRFSKICTFLLQLNPFGEFRGLIFDGG